MNALIEAPISQNWVKVAKALDATHGCHPSFWIGSWKDGTLEAFPHCTHYYAWDAFNLANAPEFGAINKGSRFWSTSSNILESMTREEYFTFLYMLNRQDSAATFGLIERDRFMKQHLMYWSNLLHRRKIDTVIHSNTPHLPYSYAIYLCAQKMGIPSVFLNPTPHEDLHYLENRIGQRLPIRISMPTSSTENAFEHATRAAFSKADGEDNEPFYMVLQKRNATSLRKRLVRSKFISPFFRVLKNYRRKGKDGVSLLSEDKRRTIKGSGPLLHSRDGILQTPAKNLKQARFRRRIVKELASQKLIADIPRDSPFVFLPLHYQPELTTVPMGGEFADQIFLAELLRECMPADWHLLIKEHWSQTSSQMPGHQGRFPGYYSELARLPSTRLVHPDVNSGPFIRASRAVATITGTAGWEGLTMGIPCLLFGHGWYRRCPGVHIIRRQADLVESMKSLRAGVKSDPEAVRSWFAGFQQEVLHFPVRGSELSEQDAQSIASSLRDALVIGPTVDCERLPAS